MGLEIINIIKKEKGMTSKQLSEKSKIPIGTLNKILNGQTKNPAYETIFALANALECPVDMFCNEVVEESDTKNTLSQKEIILLENYNKLNDLGKEKAIERVSELTMIPTYKNESLEEIYTTMAAHNDDLDTNENKEADLRILEALKKRQK